MKDAAVNLTLRIGYHLEMDNFLNYKHFIKPVSTNRVDTGFKNILIRNIGIVARELLIEAMQRADWLTLYHLNNSVARLSVPRF